MTYFQQLTVKNFSLDPAVDCTGLGTDFLPFSQEVSRADGGSSRDLSEQSFHEEVAGIRLGNEPAFHVLQLELHVLVVAGHQVDSTIRVVRIAGLVTVDDGHSVAESAPSNRAEETVARVEERIALFDLGSVSHTLDGDLLALAHARHAGEELLHDAVVVYLPFRAERMYTVEPDHLDGWLNLAGCRDELGWSSDRAIVDQGKQGPFLVGHTNAAQGGFYGLSGAVAGDVAEWGWEGFVAEY